MKWVRFVFVVGLCVAQLGLSVSCAEESTFVLEIPNTLSSPLTGAQAGTVRFWHFSAEQRTAIAATVSEQGGGALCLTLHTQPPKHERVSPLSAIGFLYDDDFLTDTKLRPDRAKRAQISADFAALSAEDAVSLLFCMNRTESPSAQTLPAGFYIDTGVRHTVLSAAITQPAVGFDYTRKAPLYAFAPNGGTVEPNSRSIDLSGVPLAFPATNTAQSVMPTLYLVSVPHEDAAPDAAEQNGAGAASKAAGDVAAVIGGERLTIRRSSLRQAEASRTALPSAALKSPFSSFAVLQNPQNVLSVLVTASDRSLLATSAADRRAVVKPIRVDPGLIMEWKRDMWRGRDYELFAWDRFPNVLIFDTATYAVQDDFFRRLAFFVEKAGYRGRLMSDSFLQNQHGYNAHDYRAESLAAFFELARTTDFALNSRELLLKEILAANGVIRIAQDGTVTAGEGAVISISQESPVYLRWTFIAHEGWHGIFFTDAEFRNTVASLYYTVDQKTLHALIRYFAVTPTLNYDTADDYLMKNEFMAYMLQRPLNQTRQYYLNLAARDHAQQTMKRDADYILQTNADGFVSAATMLDQYVGDRWNLAAGRVWLVNRQAN